MKIAVVMMVRDEADIIDKCLTNWRCLGVRDFYICDNGSIDGTWDVLTDFRMGEISNVTLSTSNKTNWPGREVINGLKDRAIDDGCDWIFPADADEFLQIPGYNNLAHMIDETGAKSGWGELPYLNILPDGRREWQRPQKKAFGLIGKGQMICMGNHLVEGIEPTIKDHYCYYEHYSLRTYPQFKRKMENYMTAFSQNGFSDHPHAVDFHTWQVEGEAFLVRRWIELTGIEQ